MVPHTLFPVWVETYQQGNVWDSDPQHRLLSKVVLLPQIGFLFSATIQPVMEVANSRRNPVVLVAKPSLIVMLSPSFSDNLL